MVSAYNIMKILSIYVWLKLGDCQMANVYRSNGSYRSYRLTSASYSRLERICKAYKALEGKMSVRNRVGAMHHSLIINCV